MGNIQVKKNGPQISPSTAELAQREAQQPWWFSRMMGFDPFREMAPFFTEERYAFAPAFEVKETKDGYLFKADVPGVNLADIDVTMTGDRLTIKGKREAEKEDKGDTYYAYERTYGSFTRSFTLPDGVDAAAITADLRDGVLSVLAPKKPESMPKKIPVSAPAPEQKKG